MTEHRYILEPYNGMSTRYHCPQCKQKNRFSRYVVADTGEHVSPSVGRCDRESKCGHHYTPKQYFQDNGIAIDTTRPKAYRPKAAAPPQKPVSFIPVEVFKASLKGHGANHFVKFLIGLLGAEVTSDAISRYFIASSKIWDGATVFWQIDGQGKIRTGKIMLYNPTTGKRIKEPYNHINWVHKAIEQPEFELGQCLFGEHLLIDRTKPVAIVESEKTAVIASVYLPQFIWLAFGGLSNFNAEKCSILKGRSVTLFPDLNGFDKWSEKAKELSHLAAFTISDLLERKATEAEKEQGFDLADYLIRFKPEVFTIPEPPRPKVIQQTVEVETVEPEQNFTEPEPPRPISWEKDISILEKWFSNIELPTEPIRLNQCSTVSNVSRFIDSHLLTVKAHIGKQTFVPYLHRLQELKQVLILNLN
ncbi:MAG: hypothetical protein JKX84_02975 [Flavobacteriales bacterium]|nr:hypothetical protein [Flavobacteriales bacterium]